ncbi:hypothetical protein Csa_020981 [Cucumis sativus]|uniref:Uncharacterized protein n=1 Tax=Cucumis sativus TaxID=3659 RepID=A0A0A0KG13_CUCSA|nr:hypothetical protein Csa_020981 [Cucumis sativus]
MLILQNSSSDHYTTSTKSPSFSTPSAIRLQEQGKRKMMEKAEVENMGKKIICREKAEESEKIYRNKRLCNKKRKRRRKNRRNSQARKKDIELSMESTSSPNVDFTKLATRTPARSAKEIWALRRRSEERE